MNSPLKRAGAIFGILAIIAAAVFGASLAAPAKAAGAPHLILTLKDGDVDIQLLPDIAPNDNRVAAGRLEAFSQISVPCPSTVCSAASR